MDIADVSSTVTTTALALLALVALTWLTRWFFRQPPRSEHTQLKAPRGELTLSQLNQAQSNDKPGVLHPSLEQIILFPKPCPAPVTTGLAVADLTSAGDSVLDDKPVVDVPATAPVLRRRPKPANLQTDTVLTPETSLARAQELLATGATEEGASQLRLCVRLASRFQQPLIEAAARLELGDLARASGDLTTACEHWQIARTLFADAARHADADVMEMRMERAGCPTDWVLTQF
jgi:hypothetical protein